ncbi:MAG: TonB-dependent receptor plug domain-containing protein [Sphingobacteriales bacterium]|nr:TonB-dependent receptor plug domain-containing protein [Sphingobacteriales bacterium]
MHKCKAFMVLGCIFSLTTEIVWAQQKDSLLPEVKVVARRSYTSTNTSMPLQILDRQRLKLLNSTNVADAVKYFSGVLVKDYGGIGGLKTVSVRSLGAAHTGVLYDGVVLADAQAGQIDLGRYPIENLQSISLQNAQPAEILNTARSFTSASILQIKTLAMADSIGNGIVAGLKAGSFKMMNPFALLQKRINNHWGLMANGEWLSSSGNYPFVDYENNQQSRLRMNSDIKSFNGSVDLSYQKSEKERFNLKGYFYHAERGLPGSIILYNHFSADRLKDKNFFLQTGYKTKVGKRDAVLLNGKYSYLLNQYFQPLGGQNYENVFHQKEYYFSTVWKHSFPTGLRQPGQVIIFLMPYQEQMLMLKMKIFPFLSATPYFKTGLSRQFVTVEKFN